MSVLSERLKGLHKPRVVLRYSGLRFEGIVLCIDENFLELYDDKRGYKKFLKINLIEDLEIVENESN